jgi:hypothetical protein
MVKMYVGVLCAYCQKFIEMDTYDAPNPTVVGLHLLLDPQTQLTCQKKECGRTGYYREVDVVHSLSPDGRDPLYSHR